MPYYVINSDSNSPSFNSEGEYEDFSNEDAARDRADEMAGAEPGVGFYVVKSIMWVKCDIGPVRRERL